MSITGLGFFIVEVEQTEKLSVASNRLLLYQRELLLSTFLLL